jgi:hypothetical protein
MSNTDSINKIISDLEDSKRKLRNLYKTIKFIIQRARDFLGPLFDYFCNNIKLAVDIAYVAIRLAIEMIEQLLKQIRCVVQFFDLDTVWRTKIARGFSDIHSNIPPGKSFIKGGVWTGEAASNYKDCVANQSTAVFQLSGASTKIADSLVKTGIAHVTFFSSAAAALTSLVLWIIGAVATAPETGGLSLLAAIGKVLQVSLLIGALIGVLASFVFTMIGSLDSIYDVSTFGNASIFPTNGQNQPSWPDGSPAY